MRNPAWIRDELILALDIYISGGKRLPSKNAREIRELSSLLSKYWETETNHAGSFRNVNGIYMKIMNFLRFDPDYTGAGRVGLSRGNKLEQLVWNEFADTPERLSLVARAIRDGIENDKNLKEIRKVEDVDDGFVIAQEGAILSKLHKVRERNASLVARKKSQYFNATGKLECEVCGFDFNRTYGERGAGFIECHHTTPLSELVGKRATTLNDLALVCANCHRMLHSQRPWLSTLELKNIINQLST